MFTTNELFFDTYRREEEGGTSISYRSGMMGLTESITDGILRVWQWNAAGFSSHSTTLPEVHKFNESAFRDGNFSFSVNVDGQALHSHWELIDVETEQQEKGLLTTVILKHKIRSITLKQKTFADGTSVLTRWLEITNTGDKPAAVSDVSVFSGALCTTNRWRRHVGENGSVWRLGYMEDDRWGCEGEFRWHDVKNGGQYFEGRHTAARYRHPMFILENRATGETFIGQIAYSGGYRFEFNYNNLGDNAHLSMKASLNGYSPLIVLDPDETMVTPELHLGMVFGGLDPAVNEMNRHIRRSVMLFGQGDVRIAPQETGIGPEMDMTLKEIKSQIDSAANVGSDIFFLDASWYCPRGESEDTWAAYVGDWFPEQDRYDASILEIREYAYSKGLKFALWMEPERIGWLSKVAKEHPEYITRGYNDKTPGRPDGVGGMIDMANPEAARWVRDQIEKVVSTYKIDMLRIDYNMDTHVTRAYHERNGYLENSEYRSFMAWYDILKYIRTKFPKLVVEGCAGGGGRTDLGMVKHTSHTWVTDWQFAPRAFSITNGMSMCLPPELIDRLSGGQEAHTIAELDFQMRLMMFGRPTVGQINPSTICEKNPIQINRIKHTIGIYNDVVRPMHETGSKVYHHTPDLGGLEPQGTGILEITDHDGHNAVLGVFALSNPEETPTIVKFKGLDMSRTYRLTMDNSGVSVEISGYKLMNKGVTVNLGSALTCELLIAQAI